MEIDRIRKEIDQIDDGILNLLNKRMDLVRKVGELKSASNSPIYRPEREKGIIDRLSSKTIAVDGLLNRAAVEAIFLEIFAIARNIELPEKIAFLGPEGSFTHTEAAESRFGAMSEYMPLSSIKAVFEAIDTKRARFGVVPLENNQEGVVNETIDFLGLFDLHIVAEVPVPINFAFATKEDNVEDVKRIFSKDIAFKQCKKFLDDTFTDSEMELIPVNSTSRAVKMALEEKNAAAICSHIAARSFRLPILFDNIEDSTDNFTRFLIISQDFKNKRSKNDKTSILTRLPDEPGSLVNFLQDFYDHKINLTKIESRPAKEGKKFKYWFYIDFDGHIDDENVKEVIKKYRKDTKWLGSYVKMV